METTAELYSGAEEKTAKFISVILHPLLMPTYGLSLLFFTRNYISYFTPLKNKLILLGITFLFTFLLPALNALILLMMGRIKTLQMETTKERVISYSGAAVYYFALCFLYYNKAIPAIFQVMMLGAAIVIVLTLLINYKWKISAHAAGIGGIAGATMGIIYCMQMNMILVFLIILLFAGISGYARLKLKAHTPAQVYTGFFLGFTIELVLMFVI